MNTQYDREIEKELLSLVKEYPVITITGPRQAGKTTLVKKLFPNKTYVNMMLTENQVMAEEDPRGFFAQFPEGCILDEVQKVPSLLTYVQDIVDETHQQGMFILTGSNQLALSNAVSQSLAGRTAILFLLPLSIQESANAGFNLTLDEYLLRGCLPRIYFQNQDPTKAYRNYLQTYLERDVRELSQIKSISHFRKLIHLCAGRVGQLINYDSLATEVGVSNNTIKDWLSVLEASYIIIKLQPYHDNFRKRLIKSPKLYFTEVGLATYLLGINSLDQLKRDPLRGQLFENFIIIELMKNRFNRGLDPNLFFYRDKHQHEIDAIYKLRSQLIPIEIKTGMTISKNLLRPIKYFTQLVAERSPNSYLIYAGENEQRTGHLHILNYRNIHEIFEERDN